MTRAGDAVSIACQGRTGGGQMTKGRTSPNIAALRRAGFEIKTPLPKEYEEVFEGLSPEELEVLMNLKKRLDQAQRSTSAEIPSYVCYWVPF
jgi:hypothetical protein